MQMLQRNTRQINITQRRYRGGGKDTQIKHRECKRNAPGPQTPHKLSISFNTHSKWITQALYTANIALNLARIYPFPPPVCPPNLIQPWFRILQNLKQALQRITGKRKQHHKTRTTTGPDCNKHRGTEEFETIVLAQKGKNPQGPINALAAGSFMEAGLLPGKASWPNSSSEERIHKSNTEP